MSEPLASADGIIGQAVRSAGQIAFGHGRGPVVLTPRETAIASLTGCLVSGMGRLDVRNGTAEGDLSHADAAAVALHLSAYVGFGPLNAVLRDIPARDLQHLQATLATFWEGLLARSDADALRAGALTVQDLTGAPVSVESAQAVEEDIGPLYRYSLAYAFGALWRASGLTRREMSIVTLSCYILTANEQQLRFHFKAARRNGLTFDGLNELLLVLTVSCGLIKTVPAARVLRQLQVRERQQEE